MNFVPLLVMNAVLLVITVLLALADRLLVTYGRCRITVAEGASRREIAVEGGGSLLTALTSHQVRVSSSCGGRGSCGYCKVRVLSGAGGLLPTEEIYMSRQEKAEGMRLACQVKVKGDMEVSLPDFLAVVRQIVLAGRFDPKKRWRVTVR
jgi:Na+-transporting NADH:ubiquinone oxidoreductase subunit F